MTPFVLLAAALGLVAVLGVTRPLWWPAPKAASDGAPPRRSPWLAPLLGVFVFAVAAVGYYGIGAPGALALHPGAPRPVEAGASAPTMEQIVAIVDKALKDNPRNPRALTLAGAIAYDRGDYALAVRHWETLAQVVPPDDPQLGQIRDSIAQARQLAGMPAAASAAAPPSRAAPAAPATAQVSGTVRLAPALQARAAPDDLVFIFARAAEGPRMPLAVLRKRVKDLPAAFTLDDSLAMSPAAKLSGVSRVIVGARISKSGNAIPQPGDLQGLAAPVAVGARDVAIEISEEVK